MMHGTYTLQYYARYIQRQIMASVSRSQGHFKFSNFKYILCGPFQGSVHCVIQYQPTRFVAYIGYF